MLAFVVCLLGKFPTRSRARCQAAPVHPKSMKRLLSLLVMLVIVGSALIGCGSSFARMLKQGDQAAAQGRLDEAASFYQQAVQIDPSNPEAQAKLLQTRIALSRLRLTQGQTLLSQGKAREALRPLYEATQLDPASAETRQSFEQARAQVLAQAQTELTAGRARAALGLAREVLAVLPNDAAAKSVEATARQAIADQSVQLGQGYEQRGELGAAVVEYAEALVFVPTHAEALRLFAPARAQMVDRATYQVLVATFTGDPKADDLGGSVGAADIAHGMPEGTLLRVTDSPPDKKAYAYDGMRLGGVFRDYGYERTSTTANSSCDYVCGKETAANPDYPRAQADLQAAQSELSSAEHRASAATAAVTPAASARDSASGAASQARTGLAAAEAALAQCHSNLFADCSALQAQRDQLQEMAQRAEGNLNRAQSDLSTAQHEAAEAHAARVRAEAELRAARHHARTTPETIEVDKHCPFEYPVETVVVRGHVEVVLRGESLYESTPVLSETAAGRFRAQDHGFQAVHGKCPELERGDPLNLPTESAVRRAVVDSAVADTQAQVVRAYEKSRLAHLESARVAEQAQKPAEAADGWLRYLLMAPHPCTDDPQALAGTARVLGVTEEAVSRAAAR